MCPLFESSTVCVTEVGKVFSYKGNSSNIMYTSLPTYAVHGHGQKTLQLHGFPVQTCERFYGAYLIFTGSIRINVIMVQSS